MKVITSLDLGKDFDANLVSKIKTLREQVKALEDKAEVLLTHIVGETCPSCGENKVVEGCTKGCLHCDWVSV